MKNVLIACEESQRVCTEFRRLGANAFSCDIQPCSGGLPEWHIEGDVSFVLSPLDHGNNDDFIGFETMDKVTHVVDNWDLIIAHPPCTYLTVTGNRWFNVEKYGEKAIQRMRNRKFAVDMFMRFVNANAEHIAIENPVGIMNTVYRKPDQIIQPYMFGDSAEKKTCLWLKNLPKLNPTKIVKPPERKRFESGRSMPSWYAELWKYPANERARMRSKTFPGIAKAMAEQWIEVI